MHRIHFILGVLLIIGEPAASAHRHPTSDGKRASPLLEDESSWGVVSNGITYVITPGGFKAPPGPGEGSGIAVNPFTFRITGTPMSSVTVRLDLPSTFNSLESNSSLPLTDWTYALPPNDVRCQLCGETGSIQGDSINVFIDSTGMQTLDIGATVSVPLGAFAGGYNASLIVSYSSSAGIPPTDSTVERTLDVETGDFWFAIDAAMTNLSRNHSYSLIPGPVSSPITPLYNGREHATIAKVPIDGEAGSEVLISTVLPASFSSDDEAYPPGLPCRFTDSSVYVEETGEYINPLPGITVRIGPVGHLTLDIGLTLTIPADAVPGSYTAQLIYSATYTGNAKMAPRIPNPSEAEVLITANVLDQDLPEQFSLLQNYPNPFNPSTTISFGLPHPANVEIKVYDVLGRELFTVLNGFRYAGVHSEKFESRNLPSGVYYYRIMSEGYTEVKKMVIAR
ncbi:MAG TPA: T9SS type A sorting domain-containing protein [Bacteroidota bacterium]|nr:T9SS type A sorting domain-containing protein [Bacteroidota bacterium]